VEYSVNTEKNWNTTVSVTVTKEDVQAQFDKALKNVQKDARIEGFRKGKVPPQLIKKLYGPQIEAEANQLCIENAWTTVFDETDLHVMNEPKVTNLNDTDSGGMTFDIVFDIRPEIKVEGYEGMDVEKVIYEVTDEDVDRALEDARQRNAMMYTIDEEAKEGHFVYADFQEVDAGGSPIIGQKIENQQIWLNENDDELTPQLIGVKAEDERRVTLKVRAQQSEIIDQAGPEEIEKIYEVKIKEVKERRIPELDDEFAKDLGEFETLVELKENVAKNLKHQAEHDTDTAFENAISDAIIDKLDFELPNSMVENYLDNIMDDLKKRQQNMPPQFDDQQYRELYRPRAERDLKWHMINEQLRVQESFEATDADVDEKLAHYSEHGDDGTKRAEEIRNNPQELERLKDGIIFDKMYAFLADKANVTEVTKPWRELHEPPVPQDDADADMVEEAETV
jgi:trigger factor